MESALPCLSRCTPTPICLALAAAFLSLPHDWCSYHRHNILNPVVHASVIACLLHPFLTAYSTHSLEPFEALAWSSRITTLTTTTQTNNPTIAPLSLLPCANASIMKWTTLCCVLALLAPTNAIHHMKRKIEARQNNGGSNTPLIVSNNCGDTIYPGIVTQAGTGPSSQGFELMSGQNKSQMVSSDWQGRIWGRTNCTFNSQGRALSGGSACGTGDCGGTVNCMATVSIDDDVYTIVHG